jgi:hypothetical protein
LQKIICQCWNVLFALTQRRQRQGDDIQSVKEIGAESSGVNRSFEIAIGGGDDAQVGGDLGGAADPFELAFLQDAQELGFNSAPDRRSSRNTVPPWANPAAATTDGRR